MKHTTIKRVINGEEVEIELTEMEMLRAYNDFENYCYEEDIDTIFHEGDYDDEDKEKPYGITEEQFKKLKSEIMEVYQESRDNDDSWVYCAEGAIRAVIRDAKDRGEL